MARLKPDLGAVQETLFIPLYGRAVETRKRRPLLRDPKAVEMVAQIDYDFHRFDRGRSLAGSVMRTLLFDHWVAEFLRRHPDGTVVEVGAGLNTRFERLDNGRVRWFDLDLPDTMQLRRRFFADTPRRTSLAASVLDDEWVEAVKATPGPYFFACEAVLMYLDEPDVQHVLGLFAGNFPGAWVALDTCSRRFIDNQHRHDTLGKLAGASWARWACDDPYAIQRWGSGYRVVETRRITDLPPVMRRELPPRWRVLMPMAALLFRKRAATYKLNLLLAPPSS